MSAINELIDRAREQCSRPSDRALAEKMKISPNSVSVWRKGGKITDEHLATLMELAKADPSIAIKIRAEQASSKAEIRLWNHMLARLAAAAMLGCMYIMLNPWTRRWCRKRHDTLLRSAPMLPRRSTTWST